VLLYFAYLVSLNALRGAIEDGSLPLSVSLLPVHLIFTGLALVLLFSEQLLSSFRGLFKSSSGELKS
jgi:lipopolysaccharide export LptBFGC system permease protein LptF